MSPDGGFISIEYPIISMEERREETASSIYKERKFQSYQFFHTYKLSNNHFSKDFFLTLYLKTFLDSK